MKKLIIYFFLIISSFIITSCESSDYVTNNHEDEVVTSQMIITDSLNDTHALPEKITIVYQPGDKFEVTDETEIREIMTSLDEIKALMPDHVSTESYEEGGDYPFYAIWTNGEVYEDIYFLCFANYKQPNLTNNYIDYNIPQEEVDILKAVVDDIIVAHGFEPVKSINE